MRAEAFLEETTDNEPTKKLGSAEAFLDAPDADQAPAAVPTAPESVPSMNMGRGAVERGGQLLGGLFTAGSAMADQAEQEYPLGGLVWEDGLIPDYKNPEEYQRWRAEQGSSEPLKAAADYWANFDAGYVPEHTWESVKREFGEGGALSGSAWGEVLAYGAEQGVKSIPDMFAAMANLPGYVMARSGEIGEERARNKGKEAAELVDVAEAAPFALGSAILERIGARGITQAGAETLGKEALKAGIGKMAKEGAKAGGKEAGTEFLQEGVIEYLGEKLGTDAAMSIWEALDRGAAGAVAGGVYGTTAGTAGAAVNEVRNRRQGEAAPDEMAPPILNEEIAPEPVPPTVQDAVSAAKAETAAAGGDALDQVLAGQAAEQEAAAQLPVSPRMPSDNAQPQDYYGRPDWATEQTNIFRDGTRPETTVSGEPVDAFTQPEQPQTAPKPSAEEFLSESGTGVFRVPVDQINVDPAQYQFRSRVNEQGVDKRLDGVKQWDDSRAGSVLLHRRTDGSLYVADGHHRVDLAKRLAQPELNARVLNEADGFDVAAARVEAAMNNIADGKAEPVDVAKVFRDSEVPAAEVRDTFNLPNSQIVRDGESLSKLSDNVFGMVTAGQLTEKDGAAIGSAFQDQSQQEAAADAFQKVEPQTDYQRQLLVNEIRAAEFAQSQGDQGGLFGEDPQEVSLMQDRLKVLDALRQRLNSDKRLFKSLNDNADRAASAGNTIATEANATISERSARSLDLIGRVTTTPALNDMVNRTARRVFDGEKKSTVVRELKQELLNYEAGSNAESGRGSGQAQGVRANAEPGQEPGAGESVSEPDNAGADQGGQPESQQEQVTPGRETANKDQQARLPEGYTLSRQKKGPFKGRWRVIGIDGFMGSIRNEQSEAVDQALKEINAREQSRRELAAERQAQQSVAEKIRSGTKPTDQDWKDAGLADDYQLKRGYVYQSDVSPFLVEYFGVPKNNIRKSIGKAGGIVRSDMGNETPIVYLDRLHQVFGEPALDLETQTEEQLAEQARAREEAQQAEARQKREEEQRATADAQVDNFTLTGSDRTADVAMAAGQDDMFVSTPASRASAADTESTTGQQSQPADTAPSQDSVADSGQANQQNATPIEDFGEKIEGARKDYASKMAAAKEKDVAAVPLSESWPEPDYQKLLESGADPAAVGMAHAARDAVPPKPRKGWKLKGWVRQVEALRNFTESVIEGEFTVADLRDHARKDGYKTLEPHLFNLADLYAAVGHAKSLKGLRFSNAHFTIFDGKKGSFDKWLIERTAKTGSFGNMPRQLVAADTKEQAIEQFRELHQSLDAKGAEPKNTRFDIYSSRYDRNDVFIGKKIGKDVVRIKEGFTDTKEARAYLAENQGALERILAKMKQIPNHRKESNSPRVGKDHRNGGDVTPEAFAEAFGFRGVQFGNYVEQGRRQQDLNEAYDGLMDLAGILNIPAKALSLNGELGLAFGARGKGGKNAPKAHYEPGNIVINLTKKSGAGSLAHEWWHSLDNYFARERGTSQHMGYATGGNAHMSVRPDVAEAFRNVKRTVNRIGLKQRSQKLDRVRTKAYWSTDVEMTARAFESYVIEKLQDQGASNDYLANIVSEEYWKASEALGTQDGDSYPYPEAAEISEVRAAYDNLFEVIEARDAGDGNVVLFSRESYRRTPEFMGDTLTVEQAEQIRDELMQDWKGAPEVIIRDEVSQLPLGLQANIRMKRADGSVRGAFWNDTVYLLASRIPDRMRMEQVLLHEVVGHYGLRKMLGGDLDRVLDQIWFAHGGKTRADFLIRQYYPDGSFDARNKEHRHEIAEELIAHLAEQNRGQTLVERAVAIIRRGLRKLGFTLDFTVEDIVDLLRRARRTVENGGFETDSSTEGAPVAASKFSKAGRAGSDRAPWPADFPKVPFAAQLGSADKHPNYKAAKSGDADAAMDLVDDLVTDEVIERIRVMIGDRKPALVPVMAEEASGHNAIPAAYAVKIAHELGLEVYGDIVQSVRAKRTGTGADYRLANHSAFDGPVEAGKDYLVVDDTMTMGGTLAGLRGHIEANGGNVVGATTLTGFQKEGQLALTEKMRQDLWRKHGEPLDEYLHQEFGYGIDSLTQGEAGHFRKAVSLDAIRDRITAASVADNDRQNDSQEDSQGVIPPGARFSRADVPDLDPEPFGAPSDTLLRKMISKIADKFTVLKGVQQNITDRFGEIEEDADAYLAEELFHGKVENDIRLIQENMIQPLAEKMSEYDVSLAQLDEFLYAKHAPERNRVIAQRNDQFPDGGSGMTNAEAAAVVDKVEKSGKLDQFQELADSVYQMLERRREILKDAGLLDEETLGAWEASYRHYVPLKGWAADEKQEAMPKIGKGFAIAGKESQMAGGRKSKASSPVANAISDLSEAVLRQRKNEVGNAFLGLVQSYPNDGYWRVYTADNPEVERKAVKRVDPATGKTVVRVEEQTVPMAMMSDRYFTTKVNGETYYIKLQDQRLMNAMRNIGPENNGLLVRSLSMVTRLMSSLNTSYNPEFVISNFSRDIQTALLNLTSEQSADDGKVRGERIATKTLKSVPIAIRAINASLKGKPLDGKAGEWQRHFDQFRKDGAKTGWFDMKDVDGQMKDLETMISMAGGRTLSLRGLRRGFNAITDWVENTNSAIENGVRLSAYVNAIEAGIPRAKAASLAKNMTVNFNRKGELGTMMNALYMFANASVQGTANFVRTLGRLNGVKGDPVWRRLNTAQKIAAGMAVGGFALSALNRLVAGDDDDGVNWWDKVPDYVKERNIVIMKSLVGGEPGEYWTIPLPYGYNIFPVIGTGMEHMLASDKPAGDIATNIVLAGLGSFSPIGFEQSEELYGLVAKNVTPTILRPVASISLNENFMGGPIFKENMPFGTPKPDSALYFRSTPEVFKALAKGLNEGTGGSEFRSGAVDLSPDVMQFLVGYYGGGAYNFFTSRSPNYVTKVVTGVDREWREVPFVRKVTGKVLPYDDQSKFYERRDEINQLLDERDNLRGRERVEFVKEYRDKIRLKGTMESVEKRLKLLRAQRDRIEAMDLSAAETDKRLQHIEKQMKRAIDQFNKRYNESED